MTCDSLLRMCRNSNIRLVCVGTLMLQRALDLWEVHLRSPIVFKIQITVVLGLRPISS